MQQKNINMKSKEGAKKQKNASSKYQLQVAQIQAPEAAVVGKNAKNICNYANTTCIHTKIKASGNNGFFSTLDNISITQNNLSSIWCRDHFN